MKITLEQRKTSEYYKKLYKKLSTIIYKIHNRCDNPKHKEYKNYGGRGVYYDSKWSMVKGFIEDVDSIQGWNEKLFMSGKLQLDKDIKYRGNKLYSANTCMWVSRKENMQVQPSRQVPFYAVNRETLEIVKGLSVVEFSKKHSLNQSVSYAALKHRKHFSGNWKLWYVTETIPTIVRLYAIRNNDILYSYTRQGLATLLNVPKGAFAPSRVQNIDNFIYKGWIIKVIPLNIQMLVDSIS